MNPPLADRMRPKTLDEFVGQEHLVGKGKPIRRMIEKKNNHIYYILGATGHWKNYFGPNYC